MARTQKYSEDLLLTAVVKYAEVCHGKIKDTELARWARQNIQGLEDVSNYIFSREYKDPNTGKMKKKLCTIKIDEINKARDIRVRQQSNTLISSANLENFFSLAKTTQIEQILEMRKDMSELTDKNIALKRALDTARLENSDISNQHEKALEDLKEMKKELAILQKQVVYLLKSVDENAQREMLEEIGIMDGMKGVAMNTAALSLKVNEQYHINDSILAHLQKRADTEEEFDITDISTEQLTDDLLGGLDI